MLKERAVYTTPIPDDQQPSEGRTPGNVQVAVLRIPRSTCASKVETDSNRTTSHFILSPIIFAYPPLQHVLSCCIGTGQSTSRDLQARLFILATSTFSGVSAILGQRQKREMPGCVVDARSMEILALFLSKRCREITSDSFSD